MDMHTELMRRALLYKEAVSPLMENGKHVGLPGSKSKGVKHYAGRAASKALGAVSRVAGAARENPKAALGLGAGALALGGGAYALKKMRDKKKMEKQSYAMDIHDFLMKRAAEEEQKKGRMGRAADFAKRHKGKIAAGLGAAALGGAAYKYGPGAVSKVKEHLAVRSHPATKGMKDLAKKKSKALKSVFESQPHRQKGMGERMGDKIKGMFKKD